MDIKAFIQERREKSRRLEGLERADLNIWVTTIILCCFGLIMVYSASGYECSQNPDYKYDSLYLFKRQAVFMVIGFVCMYAGRFLDYHLLYKIASGIYILGIICIFLLLTPLGVVNNGACRWLRVGPVTFQVAEVVKIAVIIFLAFMICRYSSYLHRTKMTIYLWLAGGIPAVLLFRISNDFSSALVVLGITFSLTFIFTETYKIHFITAGGAFAVCAAYLIYLANHLPTQEKLDQLPFRIGRVAAWLAPERYASGQGYQILQSLYAIGSGGFLGKGLGNSVQKLGTIPEAQNDMIFSIICEELGVAGAALVAGLIAYLLYCFLRVAGHSDLFGSVMVSGILFHIGIQSIINIAVNCNWFPNTGLPLPFFSYGGTSIFLLLGEVGLILAIERFNMIKAIKGKQKKWS
ncbi:FtsW/RodA/SpoVE family cell cycle protein [Ruminococcus sp. 5_1_39BFAA]|uniref:FtsW/RodA/SpoVE family cell cycle protein n=1 Tax=Ruminococcus sp. 5_1_39BFAA TaxID=457412 RepID=UPI0035681B17